MVDYVAKAIASRQVWVSGTTLYQISADYLNDATQWYRIAQLNGLSDPWIGPITSLQLPSRSLATFPSNGGILGNQTPTIPALSTPATAAPQVTTTVTVTPPPPPVTVQVPVQTIIAKLAALPAGTEGLSAYATDVRKIGEAIGAGTGASVYFSGVWRVTSTDAPALV